MKHERDGDTPGKEDEEDNSELHIGGNCETPRETANRFGLLLDGTLELAFCSRTGAKA